MKRDDEKHMARRDFLKTAGITAAGLTFISSSLQAFQAEEVEGRKKSQARVMGAFLYPPSAQLKKEGYYSWPGSSFNAEERHQQYLAGIRRIQEKLGMKIDMAPEALDTDGQVSAFVQEVLSHKPDGLLLIPFKKSHLDQAKMILDETTLPAVLLVTSGILLMPQVRETQNRKGVYLICSPDNLDAVEKGMRMICTARWMRDSRIVNIDGSVIESEELPEIGTEIRTVPHELFYEAFRTMKVSEEVKNLAQSYTYRARKIMEPSSADILEAAKCTLALRKIITTQKADALMMNCLPGLRMPHKHVPPCMGFMDLRDEGVAMGCESDVDATLTMMLLQQLFGTPGCQHNPSADTERNVYFGAHCTSASKMNGIDGPSEPLILRNHEEAGWGCVPRVLFEKDREVTIAKYLSVRENSKPQMLIYSGKIIGCPPIPPTGGCRTNFEAVLDEPADPTEVKGHHLCLVYGNHSRELKTFCQLYGIEDAS